MLRDLVERKLWPVAVLLLVARSSPSRSYLGRGSARRRRPLPAHRPRRPTPARRRKAAVTLDATRPAGDDAPRQRAQPLQAAARAQGAPSRPTDDQTPAAEQPTAVELGRLRRHRQPPLGSAAAPAAPAAPGTGDATPKPRRRPARHLPPVAALRPAEAAQLKTYHDVARLSPLPSADNPFFVYPGVLKDGKTAVFLLSSDATATGDGHCRPSAKSCQTIEVKEGDTEFFDLTVDGEAVQYQLDVVQGLQEGRQHRGRRRGRLRQRHSNAGADLLRQAHRIGSSAFKGAAAYRWLPDSGVLVRTPQHAQGARVGQRRRRRLARRRHGRAARACRSGHWQRRPAPSGRKPSIHFGARWR